ncbi:MAG: hypothetical protein VB009_00965 [Erysipelotrichaceae bacterium]|nr:hypothetical protein [Erysipelotrichaceae bacterium]
MRKVLLLFILVLLVGCGVKKPLDEVVTLKILSPKGAPSLALVGYIEDNSMDDITLVDGTDVISAALLNPNPEYDVIIAPINLGVTTIQKGSDYQLLGVITWGNLYIVENTDLSSTALPMALFGEGAVPQKVVDAAIDLAVYSDDIRYFNSVSDVQVALLSKAAAYGLLAEPALSATLIKANENNINLEVIVDVQAEYNNKNNTIGYPQAAIFVRSSTYQDIKLAVDELVAYFNDLSVDQVVASISGNEQEYGVASSNVVALAWDKMNIEYKKATEVKNEIIAFLKLFNINDITGVIID